MQSPTQAEVIEPREVIRKAFSNSHDSERAAQELYDALEPDNAAMVMFFCCVDYDLNSLSDALSARFGDIPVVGCTTAGEISPEGYVQNSITAFSFPADLFQVETRLICNLWLRH